MDSASILSGKKFKIQQSVPSGSIKRGPQTIMRNAELNDVIEIKRRFGEGSKPIFADIPVPKEPADSDAKLQSKPRSSSSESSVETYRHREKPVRSHVASTRRKSPPSRFNYNEKPVYNSKFEDTNSDKYTGRKEKSKTRSPSPVKKKPTVKLPYYRDEVREKDRLRRLYGSSRSPSPPARRRSPISRRRFEYQYRRRRSVSSERRGSRRDQRRQRSRTPSRTRSSPQRYERRKHSNRDEDKDKKNDSSSVATAVAPAPQIIPIAVPVPADYMGYSFPGWTPQQPPWHPTAHRPPPLVPYPMWPMVPPMRTPHQGAFAGMPSSLQFPMGPLYRAHVPRRYAPPKPNANQSKSKKPST